MELQNFIRDISDYPQKGIMFKDLTPMFQNAGAFRTLIEELAVKYNTINIDYVVGLEARGFIIAAALAYQLGCGFIPIRKKGKLPADKLIWEYELEYGKACVELHKDAVQASDKVLMVDDVIATGGTAVAGIELLKQLKADIIEFAAVINLQFLGGDKKIKDMGIPVRSLFDFE